MQALARADEIDAVGVRHRTAVPQLQSYIGDPVSETLRRPVSRSNAS